MLLKNTKKKMKQNKKGVAIAMSGGVDSSVAALLLKKKYNEVFGITMKHGEFAKKSVKRAKKIAKVLGIKHYVFDLEKEFREKIITNFCNNYFNGQTPNPCVFCNEKIKFGLLLEKAKSLGANLFATGHYVRLKKEDNCYQLYKGKDRTREQSYFLYRLSQDQLKCSLFPLGRMKKGKIEKIAKKNNINLAKQESREICFIKNDYRNFLKQKCPQKATPGLIVKNGKKIGTHKGLAFYTIGQRKGLPGGQKKPIYVTNIVKKNNTLIVGEEKDLYKNELIANNLSWICKKDFDLPLKVDLKIRYETPSFKAKIISINKDSLKLEFEKSQKSISPGQSVVFYVKEKVLGGGVIKSY